MIPLKRTLTFKSKLGFGKRKDLTVQQLIDLRMVLDLISPYYKLTSINYTDEVLDCLGITDEYRIEKPGANREMYYKFLEENGFTRKPRNTKSDKLRKRIKHKGKDALRIINQQS